MEMSDALEALNRKEEIARDKQGVVLRAMSRRVSIGVRKILLDTNARLFKSCIYNPKVNPLKRPGKRTLVCTQEYKEVNYIIGRQGKGERRYTIPSYQHVTELHSLPGIELQGKGKCTITTPFDDNQTPIKFTRCLAETILQVDTSTYTVEQLLRIMADNEAAHINPSIPMVTPDVPMEQIGNRTEARYTMTNVLIFGVLTFPQILTMYTGMYIKNRVREMLSLEELRKKIPKCVEIQQRLARSLDHIRINATVSTNMHPMVLFGEGDEIRGDYREGITTKIQMPSHSHNSGSIKDGV